MEEKTARRILMGDEEHKRKRGKRRMNTAFLILGILLGVLCFLYGTVIWSIASGTRFYLVWFLLGMAFAGTGIFGYLDLWKKVPGFLQKLILVLVIAGALIFLIVEGVILSQMHQTGKKDLDYILVLGAQVRQDGPCAALKYRLDQAAEYLQENPNTLCVVSGGQGHNEPFSEAEGMAAYLLEKNIEPKRLILEAESRTTAENIKNSRRLIRENAEVGIITNDFHMFRAMQIARSQGMKNFCGISAKSTKAYLPNNLLREFFAELKHLLRLFT